MRTKAEMLDELRTMLHDLFTAKAGGAGYPRLGRAHGYVDGYMRALLELEVATNGELLALVANERHRVNGPALGELAQEPTTTIRADATAEVAA